MLNFPLGLLRLFSLLDGASFLILLYFSIYEKRILGHEEAIRLPGMIHGGIFCVFFLLLILCWDRRNWSLLRAAKVLLAAFIPFAPFLLEPSLKREQENR